MVAQASEANDATNETPAEAVLLRALRLAFLGMGECNFEADEVIIDSHVTRLRLL